jgi:hypothetical protein
VEAHRVVRRRGIHSLLDNRLTDAGEVVSLTRCLPFTPGRFMVFASVRGRVDSRVIVLLVGLGQFKKSSDLIGNRNRDCLACSIVPQPTALPRAPALVIMQPSKILYPIESQGARGSVVGWGAILQAGRSRVQVRWGHWIFFNWHNPSSRTMALGSTQPLTEMSTGN